MRVLADATLPELDVAFPPPFQLTRYHTVAELQAALPTHHILLCRSTCRVNQALLKHHRLQILMTASSGRDHLDEAFLSQQQTTILDAKGVNAPAVVDYVLSCLTYLKQHHDFHPRTVGIIGVGAVGSRLAARLLDSDFQIFPYDPPRTLRDPAFESASLQAINQCDLVCIHANLHTNLPYPSYHLIDSDFLQARTPHTAIINASRGDVVDETALLKVHRGLYCTDVYSHEPNLTPGVIQHATLCTPHIAGHTTEAKINIIRHLSRQLHAHLQLSLPAFPNMPLLPQPHVPYDPGDETQQLKQRSDLKAAFLALRQAHVRNFPSFSIS